MYKIKREEAKRAKKNFNFFSKPGAAAPAVYCI
jgi:hypothetical protein